MRGFLLSALLAAGVSSGAGGTAALAEQPWGYEQVSPPNKGEGVLIEERLTRPSPDGDGILYAARSPFAGVPSDAGAQLTRYFATRGSDGWTSRGVDPASDVPNWVLSYATIGSSADVSHALVGSELALTPGATAGGGNLYMRDTRTRVLTLVATSGDVRLSREMTQPSGAIAVKYVANDGRSALFQTAVSLVPGAPSGALYRWTADGGVEAVSVLPADESGAITTGGTVGEGEFGTRDAMPGDAHALDHIYFYARDASSQIGPLYVRTGDETRPVSVPRTGGPSAPAVPAKPDAISAGGRYVVFHTFDRTPLTTDTPPATGFPYDATNYLYRYDVTDGSLDFIGVGGLYNDAILQMSPDGETVAFQSTAALTEEAVSGQTNMYVWRHGTLRFVETADLGSFPENNGYFLRLLSPNGRYLAFTDNSVSTAQRVGFDNRSVACHGPFDVEPAGCTQVYRFDADANPADALTCASCRTDGKAPEGHSGDVITNLTNTTGQIAIDRRQQQTVIDDGTVFFTSPDPLKPGQDVNGGYDVYAFHDGQQRLVSRGRPGSTSRFQDATLDGRSIYFSTNDPIAATDVDRSVDLYMTREGAGFGSGDDAAKEPCRGVDCRPAVVAPILAPVAASVSFVGAGDLSGEPRPPAATVKASETKAVRGSAATVRVKVSGKGTIAVTGSGLRRAAKSTSRAATYAVTVTLTATSKARLKARHTVRVKATVAFTPKGAQRVTQRVTLTFTAPKAARSARGGR